MMPSAVAQRWGPNGVAAAVIGPQHTDRSLIRIAIPANVNRVRAQILIIPAPRHHRVGIAEVGILRDLYPKDDRMRRVFCDACKSRLGVKMAVEMQIAQA